MIIENLAIGDEGHKFEQFKEVEVEPDGGGAGEELVDSDVGGYWRELRFHGCEGFFFVLFFVFFRIAWSSYETLQSGPTNEPF